MRPLSDVLAKPALPLPQGPLVGWPLRLAVTAGVRSAVVNTWHKGESVEAAVRACDLGGLSVVFSREEALMGTAGGLAVARDRRLVGGGGVLVLNGDTVMDIDLAPLLDRHARCDDLVTLALLRHPDPARWSRVYQSADGLVERFTPPAPAPSGGEPMLYSGVMMVSAAALEVLPRAPGGVMEHLWLPALRHGRLGGVVVEGQWQEVGTPAAYLDAVRDQLAGVNLVDQEAEVDGSASLDCAMVGRATRVERGAWVLESVVAEGAVVRAGAVVERSVLLGAVEAAPGEMVIGEIRAAPRVPGRGPGS